MRLKAPTSPLWTEAVLRDFDAFLRDHANCERKASGSAMNMVSHYPDRTELVTAMIDLAREELEHFHGVYQHMASRGLALGPDLKDPYVRRLSQEYRKGSDAYFLDRLLAAGVPERLLPRHHALGSAPPGPLRAPRPSLLRPSGCGGAVRRAPRRRIPHRRGPPAPRGAALGIGDRRFLSRPDRTTRALRRQWTSAVPLLAAVVAEVPSVGRLLPGTGRLDETVDLDCVAFQVHQVGARAAAPAADRSRSAFDQGARGGDSDRPAATGGRQAARLDGAIHHDPMTGRERDRGRLAATVGRAR